MSRSATSTPTSAALTVSERWAARDDAAIRTQLIDVVHALRPAARVRSYAAGVASFVDGKYLIIARYGEPAEPPPGTRAPSCHADQDQLFEDVA